MAQLVDSGQLRHQTTRGLRTYVGPVSSYYEDLEPNFTRLTDEEWKGQFANDALPPRPPWTAPWGTK